MTNIAKSYWKPFAGLATKSRPTNKDLSLNLRRNVRPAARRVRFGDFFFLALVPILGAAAVIGVNFWYAAHYSDIRQRFLENYKSHREISTNLLSDDFIMSWGNNLLVQISLFDAVILAATIFFTVKIAGRTLRPIEEFIRDQKRFIDDAAHELRTPLAIIKTSSEIALMSEANSQNSPEIDVLLEVIKGNVAEVDRMAGIIQNLISISNAGKDKAGQVINFSKINLSRIVSIEAEAMKFLYSEKNINIVGEKLETAWIWGNGTALKEMVSNLLRNAVLYTPQGGSVTFNVVNAESGIEFMICDTGVGIDPEDLPHIFNPFYRTKFAREELKNSSGSGLGLTIVREVVNMHHGSIEVKSKVGEGTTIIARFPAATT